MRDGRLTLPMPPVARERVLRVKRGDVPVLAQVLDKIDGLQGEIEARLAEGHTRCRQSRTGRRSRRGRCRRTGGTGAGDKPDKVNTRSRYGHALDDRQTAVDVAAVSRPLDQ